MLIREIILENFMSYEYARLPLKSGLNIICGPNGSGKSSILLAISVALGQTYTERSRRLSDLIRWGEDSSRVTLVFDNSPKKGKRPVTRFDVDYFRISRYLNKGGDYWFEVNFKTATKREVTLILNEFGLNPDNMLIIMHQRMMEEFGITTPEQRLTMVEEAIGLSEYRKNVIDAQNKLIQVLSEEESVKNLFENAEQTLAYWKEEYTKYQRRNELIQRKIYLRKELIWAQITRHQISVNSWKEKVKRKEENVAEIKKEIENNLVLIQKLDTALTSLHFDQRKLFYSLMTLEKEKTEHTVIVKMANMAVDKIHELEKIYHSSQEVMEKVDFTEYTSDLNSQISVSKIMINDLTLKINTLQSQLATFDEELVMTTKKYVNARVREGLLKFQHETFEKDLKNLQNELQNAEEELANFQPLPKMADASKIKVRPPHEISEEIKIVNIQLTTIGELSEDVERVYLNYLNVFTSLKKKMHIVTENREQVLRHVKERMHKWQNILQSLLNTVSLTYQEFLLKINATGTIQIMDAQDIETAGLGLTVGFRGAEPAILDALTQSGGERSTATMAFLLALQQFVKSPFRAVDEFDIHMDPRNRETIYNLLYTELKGDKEAQYITITPGQISSLDGDVHVITVQNVKGKSEIMVVE